MMKEYNDKTKSEWLLNEDQYRNMAKFKVGQMVVAKRTVWSKSHDDNHVPSLLIVEGKQYEVIYTNHRINNISIRDEVDKSSWDLDPHEWANYEFPFYTIQEWRDKILEEIGITEKT